MRRLCALLGAALCCAGCAAEGGPGFFDAALKDLRGDNMEMRSGDGFARELGDQPTRSRSVAAP
jgi:hypothetical protein